MVVLILPGISKILELSNKPSWSLWIQIISWMFAVPQRKKKPNNIHLLSNDLQFICSNNNNISHPTSKLLFLLEKADADREGKWRSWTIFPLTNRTSGAWCNKVSLFSPWFGNIKAPETTTDTHWPKHVSFISVIILKMTYMKIASELLIFYPYTPTESAALELLFYKYSTVAFSFIAFVCIWLESFWSTRSSVCHRCKGEI